MHTPRNKHRSLWFTETYRAFRNVVPSEVSHEGFSEGVALFTRTCIVPYKPFDEVVDVDVAIPSG